MLKLGQDAWSDEKIAATVDTHYVYTFIGEVAQQPVPEPAAYSGTYAQVIVNKAKRLFLTLIDVGLPQDIVRLIDEYYDDTYLPFAQDEIASLRLSNSNERLDQLFYRQQFKYHIRVLREGEHIRYATVEYAPFLPLEQKVVNGLNDGPEKVRIPSPVNRVFVRRQLTTNSNQTEDDLLHEIAAAKPLTHDHILSIYGSYTQNEHMYLLISPTTRYNLKSLLNDSPKTFESLQKFERRRLFLTWPHCLANALAWLHAQDAHHGAVRPSRILIDDKFHVSLGEFEGDWLLATSTPKSDIESYQYAAPELWKRGLTVQTHTTPARSAFSLGGRSAGTRLVQASQHDDPRRTSNDLSSEATKASSHGDEGRFAFVPAMRGNTSRLQLKPMSRTSVDLSAYVRNTESRLKIRSDDSANSSRPKRSLSRRLDGLSIQSSNSSEADRSEGPRSKLVHSIPLDTKQTMVQAWKSSAHDMAAADVFALGSVAMDIYSVLCGRSVSAFAKHRSSKNRQAGRGGGLADASFHANLSQVMSWAESLLKDSEKKVKKESGQIFSAMGQILQTTIQCFEREPAKRPKAKIVALQLQKHLSSLSEMKTTHCSLKLPEETKERDAKTRQNTSSRLQQQTRAPVEMMHPVRVSSKRDSFDPRLDPRLNLRDHGSENAYSERATMVTAPSSPREHSFASRTPPSFDDRMRMPKTIDQETEEISDDLFLYYEDQWKSAPQVRLNPQNRRVDNRVWRDYTRDHFQETEEDTRERHRPNLVDGQRQYNYSPSVVNAAAGDYEQPQGQYADYEYRAGPNRELPMVPTMPNSKKPRNGTIPKRPWTPHGREVAQATSALAQTVESLDH